MNNDQDNFNVPDLAAADLTPETKRRVQVLRDIQSLHDQIKARFLEEKAALEDKFQKLFQPLYAKRSEIVNAVDEAKGAPEAKRAPEEKGIPFFWLVALKNNEVTAGAIGERDEDALKYLTDIQWTKIEDSKGFKLVFCFDKNPYFKNNVLTKAYLMIDEDKHLVEKAVGTEIQWYPGKSLTQIIHGKKSKKAEPKIYSRDSFFNFFNASQLPEEDEEMDEETAKKLQRTLEEDYKIGLAIRNKIIPHACSWFSGEASAEDDALGF